MKTQKHLLDDAIMKKLGQAEILQAATVKAALVNKRRFERAHALLSSITPVLSNSKWYEIQSYLSEFKPIEKELAAGAKSHTTIELPMFSGYAPDVVRELQAAFTMAAHRAGLDIVESGTPVIDLSVAAMESILRAVESSPWVPAEYSQNELIGDICSFLGGTR